LPRAVLRQVNGRSRPQSKNSKNGRLDGPQVFYQMLGKVLNNQNEMKERMDRNESRGAGQQLEQNINLGIPVSSLEALYELEEKLVQPAYMSQLVFKLFNNQTLK
jgi:hypothetical protein